MILSGGKNSRMNFNDKAFIEVQDIPVIQNTVKIFKEIFDEIIIVTNSSRDYKKLSKDCIIVNDMIKGIGPLGGIHSALSHTSKEKIFIAACDMPFLNRDLIKRLVEISFDGDYDCIVPGGSRGIEPLHAVYSKKILGNIGKLTKENDFSLKRLLNICKCKYVEVSGEEEKSFFNINTPNDIEEARILCR